MKWKSKPSKEKTTLIAASFTAWYEFKDIINLPYINWIIAIFFNLHLR